MTTNKKPPVAATTGGLNETPCTVEVSTGLLHALAYAARGWRIFPLRPNSKLPSIKAWNHLATTDVAAISAWWAAMPASGVAIATGHDLLVLDVDNKQGKTGTAALTALISAHGDEFPATLVAQTPSGGYHFYFRSTVAVRNSVEKLGPGLDMRAAGGYVVAPPTTIDGVSYRWLDPTCAIADAPSWLVAAAIASAPPAPESIPLPPVEVTAELVADLRSALQVLSADNRADWVARGAALKPLGDVGRELWLDWSQTSDKYNDGDEMQWDSIGSDNTGPAAIFAAAARTGQMNPATLRRLASVGFGPALLPPGATDTGPALRFVAVGDVMTATVPPPRFVVDRLIPCDHLTLFGSHGGAGKSILALAISAHVAAGVPWAGFAVEHRPVLFVSLEDSGELVRFRLRNVITAYCLDAAAVAANLSILDGSAGQTALMIERAAFGVRQLEATATLAELRAAVGDAGLIVIDNASDAFSGSENDRQQVRTFIRALAELGHATHAGVLLLAHIDKAAARFGSVGNSYSGSSAWHNSARSRLALVETKSGIELVQEKLNLGRAAVPVRLAWSPDGVLMPDLATYVDASNGSDADAVLCAIVAAIKDGQLVPTARRGNATTQQLLESVPELPKHLRGVRGREDFWAAITELQRSGRIVVEEYQTAARNTRQRYVVASVSLVLDK